MTVLILSAGIFLRLLMLLSNKSFWGDEWYSIRLSQMSLSDMLYTTTFVSNHPPLYLFILNLWVRMFGPHEWAYRGLSLLANASVILGVYWVAKELFEKKVATLSALFVAISPYFLQLSNEVRSYSVLTAFTCFATIFLLKAVKKPSNMQWRWIYVFLTLSALYTEHYAWLWLFGLSIYLGYLILTNRQENKSWMEWQGFIFFVGLISIMLIVFQAITIEKAHNFKRLIPYFSSAALLKKGVGVFWHLVCGPVFSMLTVDQVTHYLRTSPMFWLSLVVTAVSVFIVGSSLFHLFKFRRDLFWLFFPIVCIPVVSLLVFYPIRLSARYVCWAAPLFFILLARGTLSIALVPIRTLFFLLFFTTAVYGDVYLIQIKTDAIHKEDYRAMVRYAFENAGQKVGICGIGEPTTFYAKSLGLETKGVFYETLDQLAAARPNHLEEIWTLLYIDKDPKENETGVFLKMDRIMAALGFRRSGNLLRFGGPDALTAVQVYRRVPKGGS